MRLLLLVLMVSRLLGCIQILQHIICLMGAQIGEQDDPPVGSSIPAFAAFLCAHQHLAKGTYCYTVERGLSNLRHSLLHIELDHKGRATLAVRIGGNGIIMSKGEMFTSHLKAVN